MDRSITTTMKKNDTTPSVVSDTPPPSKSTPPSTPSKQSRRKSNSLPPETVEYLKAWMMSPEHIAHPYPTEHEKAQIMADTGIELKQLTNWFVNNRKRYWKPRVEARLQEQASVHTSTAAVKAAGAFKQIDTRRASTPANNSLTNFSLRTVVSANPSSFVDTVSGSIHGSYSKGVTRLSSPARTVSDQSSLSSENDSIASASDDEVGAHLLSAGQATNEKDCKLLTQTEYVNIHILRPADGMNAAPTVEDVTILNNVPSDRVLSTFHHCPLTYSVPSDAVSNNSKIQSRRDAEIERLKMHYLNVFLSKPLMSKRKLFSSDEDSLETPRPKFRRVSLEMWKEACLSAEHNYYHSSLPSLEEAATLFGFANS